MWTINPRRARRCRQWWKQLCCLYISFILLYFFVYDSTKTTDLLRTIYYKKVNQSYLNIGSQTKTSGDTDQHILLMQKRQSQRREVVKMFCLADQVEPNNKDLLPEGVYAHLMVDELHRLIYCSNAKTGSTTWGSLIMRLVSKANTRKAFGRQNLTQPRYGMKKLKRYSEEERKRLLRTYLKFVTVRHPIPRLVSMYLERFQAAYEGSEVHYKNMGIATDRSVPFETLMKYITNNTRTDNKDFHWQTYFESCAPCHIEYDVIVKHESFVEDSNYILKMVNETARIPYREYKADHNTTKKYWNTLSDETKKAVIAKYESSAQVFGYDINVF